MTQPDDGDNHSIASVDPEEHQPAPHDTSDQENQLPNSTPAQPTTLPTDPTAQLEAHARKHLLRTISVYRQQLGDTRHPAKIFLDAAHFGLLTGTELPAIGARFIAPTELGEAGADLYSRFEAEGLTLSRLLTETDGILPSPEPLETALGSIYGHTGPPARSARPPPSASGHSATAEQPPSSTKLPATAGEPTWLKRHLATSAPAVDMLNELQQPGFYTSERPHGFDSDCKPNTAFYDVAQLAPVTKQELKTTPNLPDAEFKKLLSDSSGRPALFPVNRYGIHRECIHQYCTLACLALPEDFASRPAAERSRLMHSACLRAVLRVYTRVTAMTETMPKLAVASREIAATGGTPDEKLTALLQMLDRDLRPETLLQAGFRWEALHPKPGENAYEFFSRAHTLMSLVSATPSGLLRKLWHTVAKLCDSDKARFEHLKPLRTYFNDWMAVEHFSANPVATVLRLFKDHHFAELVLIQKVAREALPTKPPAGGPPPNTTLATGLPGAGGPKAPRASFDMPATYAVCGWDSKDVPGTAKKDITHPCKLCAFLGLETIVYSEDAAGKPVALGANQVFDHIEWHCRRRARFVKAWCVANPATTEAMLDLPCDNANEVYRAHLASLAAK